MGLEHRHAPDYCARHPHLTHVDLTGAVGVGSPEVGLVGFGVVALDARIRKDTGTGCEKEALTKPGPPPVLSVRAARCKFRDEDGGGI
jgi:hypothetical protein